MSTARTAPIFISEGVPFAKVERRGFGIEMANSEHVAILTQGVEVWNKWNEAGAIGPDLAFVNLENCELVGANFRNTELYGANLTFAKLTDADLSDACLANANLSGADLNRARLANADLTGANLNRANLNGADVSHAVMAYTVFNAVDLRDVNGLETVVHASPSSIGIDTLYHSDGRLPESFLRGAGLPEEFINLVKSLSTSPQQYYSCFISYSSVNQEFATSLCSELRANGVSCWLAAENLKIGDSFRQRIEESIRLHDKLLLIFSEHSVQSPWVQDEVEAALERERRENRLVLFPIRIDNAIMKTEKAWAASIRRTRHIGDFSNWKDHDSYQQAFQRC